MTEKQKFQAMKAICPEISITMNMNSDWCCSMKCAEVKSGSLLRGVVGFAPDVNTAIDGCWRSATELKPEEYLVIGAYSGQRKAYRWNGFMWSEVEEKPTCAS